MTVDETGNLGESLTNNVAFDTINNTLSFSGLRDDKSDWSYTVSNDDTFRIDGINYTVGIWYEEGGKESQKFQGSNIANKYLPYYFPREHATF